MKSGILSVILLMFFESNLLSQTNVTGIVTDSLNNPVSFASVYLSKTTIGTYTDINGFYSLQTPREGPYEIIVSCIGYKLNSLRVYVEGKIQKINFKLRPNVFLLNEVVIKGKDKNRRKNYTQFIKSFIGETANSSDCKILNPEDLHLYKDTENDILKGYSLKPLQVENKALGYIILYDLTDFSYNIKTGLTQFSGFNYFQPLTGTEKRNKFWDHNRLSTYYGSRMHFMRALFSDSLSRESYKIFEGKFDTLSNEYSMAGSVQLNAVRFLNSRPYVTLLFNDSTLISYTDNHPGLDGKQLVPRDIEKGLFSDTLSRTNYKITKLKTDTLINDFSGINTIPEKNLKLSTNKDYVTLFYKNPLIINYINNYSENPVLQQYEKNRLFANLQMSLKTVNPKPSAGQADLKPGEYRSTISFSDTLRLYQNGNYFEPYSVTWKGAMANERIADMLPLDFVPGEKGKDKSDTLLKTQHLLTPDFIETLSSQVAEKVYLHTDRTSYTSGDDIWFKAYVIDPSTNLLSVNTNNLHVELISPDSKIVLSRTLRIEKGLGKGDFPLPDSIPSGQYKIRAYTNHMRNYDDHFFFTKEITIISPFDKTGGLNNTVQRINNKIDVSFFPEGGSLVDNVTSTVAFKAVNALGKGCDVTVSLFSSVGRLITEFKSLHLGMGYFKIKPLPGFSYYAIVKSIDGSETRAELSRSFPTGVTINTSVTPAYNLILNICTNDATLPSVSGREFTVILSSRGLINRTAKVKISSPENSFLLPVDSLPEGIMKVTLYEDKGLPLCEKLVYLQGNNDIHLNITTDKKEYKPREKVTTEISLSGDTSLSGTGAFSFSAADARFTDNSSLFPTSVASWFLLESDVKGKVEEPYYYFDPSNNNRLRDLDLLLMTQGWRDFKWKYDSKTSFNSETGFTISGKAKTFLGNKPLEGAKLNIGLFGNHSSKFMSSFTDSSGIFKVKDVDITGRNNLFISATGRNERPVGRIFLDSVLYQPAEIADIKQSDQTLILNTKTYSQLRQEASYRLEIRKKYKLSDTLYIGEVTITGIKTEPPEVIKVKESRRMYGTPDKELKINPAAENYAGDVFSFIAGRIAGVSVVRGQDPGSIYYPNDADVFIRGQFTMENIKGKKVKRGALILLDGYEVTKANLSSILTLPMNIVDRIDVLNASPLYGMQGANGVINIITRVGVRRGPAEQGANIANVTINGYDVPRIFYSPNYENKTNQAFLPDYRSTIFWEPVIRIEKDKSSKLKYYNADNPSLIKIIVEGVTEEGIPVTGKTTYVVK